MSSEMRVTDEMVDSAVRVAVEWDGADAISPQVMRAALHAALLARTEAGADGAEPFGWWIECHGTDGDFGQFVTDRAFVELLRSHGVVERETALFTHPQDASGDAEVAWRKAAGEHRRKQAWPRSRCRCDSKRRRQY
jgi:hypothetical protein